MILSHSKRFIFIHLYKTGGTSIRRSLEKYDSSYSRVHRAKSLLTKNSVFTSPVVHKHADARTIREKIGPEVYDSYFSFAIVRNPWDWQVSLYRYVLRDETNEHHKIFKSFRNFEAYLDWRCAEDVHFQKDHIVDENGKVIVNFIGRMESLNQDFKTICLRIGIEEDDLPHLNKSRGDGYQSFYSPRMRDLLYDTYKTDIDFFGYDFEPTRDSRVQAADR